ncbi:hypothetical protein [Deinococcus aerophilus]|uniref:Tetratricopeptide repeat protein n=1 Tax=Deinococcus aerophilus TaxID=522488 RepID=A0ABQ2GKV4_9DEIO|nr:hypothetical protein [Deinococcus aerophilus]GGM00202.1 hypothetical protein GCM10010841_05970 [Deinococcus aerophilus]
MTDPARTGPPTAPEPAPARPSPAAVPTAPLPDLNEVIRAGEWRRALAVSRLSGATPEVQEALEAVFGIQEAVRARRYPSAQRSLAAYREALGPGTTDTTPGESGVIRRTADPDALGTALDALIAHQKEPDPQALHSALEPALAQPLTRAEALNMLGVLRAVRDEGTEARTHFEAALAADAGHYRALTNLGNLDLEAGDFKAAEVRYREVIRLCPEYDGGHHNLGVALRRQGKMGEAVRSIRRGQQLGMKRSKEDTDAEIKAQFASSRVFRSLRWVLIAGVGGVLMLGLRGLMG